MTKSRTALFALPALALAIPAPAQTVTADEAIAAQRNELRAAMRPVCRATEDPEEIVVCATRQDEGRYRVAPSPVAAGSRSAELAGGAQLSAMAVNDEDRCSAVGRHQQCGYVDFLGMGMMIAQKIVQAIEDGD